MGHMCAYRPLGEVAQLLGGGSLWMLWAEARPQMGIQIQFQRSFSSAPSQVCMTQEKEAQTGRL